MDLSKREGLDRNNFYANRTNNLEKLERKSKRDKTVKLTILILVIVFLIIILLIGIILFKSLLKSDSNILLKLNSVYISPENDSAIINIEREGAGEMTKLEFSFYDFQGNSYLYYYDLPEGLPVDGEIKTYRVDSSWIPDLKSYLDLDYVSIVYYYINSNGEEVSSSIQDSFGNKPFEDIRDPGNNITQNPAPVLNRTISRGGGGGGGRSSPPVDEPPSCSPDSTSVTCSDKCGSQLNNCNQAVNCGLCLQQEWCNGSDVTHNGVVDTSDYIVWRFSQNCVANSSNNWCNNADINRDGLVNGEDYSLWISKFGYTGCVGSANPIACFSDVECGNNGFTGVAFCSNGNVNQNYISFTCNNPGTTSSSCSNITTQNLTQTCTSQQLCNNGQCLPVSCSNNAQCGTNSNSTNYCFANSNSVYTNTTTYTCNNPGTINSMCDSSTTPNLVQACPADVYSPTFCRVANLGVVYHNLTDNFCSSGGCTSSIIQNLTKTICTPDSNSSNFCRTANLEVVYYNLTDNFCSGGGCSSILVQNLTKNVCSPDFNSSNYCDASNLSNVYYNLTDNFCSSGGCSSNVITKQIKSVCSSNQICSGGACVNVACNSNSQCGSNGFTGAKFCNITNGNVYQNFTSFTCNNPGTPSSICTNSVAFILNQTCPTDVLSPTFCRTANLGIVYHNLTDSGCNNGACILNVIQNITNTTCAAGQQCSNGACVNVACNSNSECGNNFNSSVLYCLSNNVYINSTTPICNNPGTPSSSCANSTAPILVQTCSTSCSNGVCSSPILTSISTCQELQKINDNLNLNYTLVNDIDCSDTINWNSGKGFKPIGNGSNLFAGNFNGNNHTISNIYISRSDESFVALFGQINGSNITNVGLNNFNINGSSAVGGLVGNSNLGLISNSYANGNVNGSSAVGGLVGQNDHGLISNSYTNGKVNGNIYVGGLVGYNFLGLVKNSYSVGNVSGVNNIGGLVGYSSNGNISNSYSTARVIASASGIGALVGFNSPVSNTIFNSYWNSYPGGPLNCFSGGNAGCTAIQDNINYFKGDVYPSNAPFSSWGFFSVWQERNNDYPSLTWQNLGGNFTTTITTISISTCQELQDINNNPAANYILTNDIDCSATIGWNGGLGFIPIANATSGSVFTGNFNGNNHTISNLYINRKGIPQSYIGLFSIVDSGKISNVGLININISGNSNVGGLVGWNQGGNISNSYTTGNVYGFTYSGGLVGYSGSGNIINSYSKTNVNGDQGSAFLGGLVGQIEQGSISNSYSSNNLVTGGSVVGGLLGSNNGGVVSKSYSNTSVLSADSTNFGGLVGSNVNIGNTGGIISDSFATGIVVGNGSLLSSGGLVGYNGAGSNQGIIINSYWNNHSLNPNNCYSGGDIGCFVVQNNNVYFYSITNSPMASSWDFVNTWSSTKNGVSYPILKFQEGQLSNLDSNFISFFIDYLKELFGYK